MWLKIKMYVANIYIAQREVDGDGLEEISNNVNDCALDMYKKHYETICECGEEPVFYMVFESRMKDVKWWDLPSWEELKETYKPKLKVVS